VEAGCQHAAGNDQVDRLHSGHASQQVEVCGIQSAGIGNPVGDGDHDRASRRRKRPADQPFSQGVLVEAARGRHPALVGSKGGRQQTRLLQHPLGAPIEFRVPAQRFLEQLLEPHDLLSLPAQLIVEAQHLGDQPGPQLKHRRRAGAERVGSVACGGLRDHFTLERGETPNGIVKAGSKAIVELVARQYFHRAFVRILEPPDETAQLPGCARVGHDHKTARPGSEVLPGTCRSGGKKS